jgi:hypothetical protein
VTAHANDPAAVLERSRVDLIQLIAAGLPPRAFVPGADGLLPKGKRVHIAAEKKTGKSLSIGVVTAVEIVSARGCVVVLDRENGSDEYARRLANVLDARGADDAFRETVRERLLYHAWPALSLAWRDDPTYVSAFGDADVVIFDSSRSHLTPLGLKEDQSDDYAAFTTALIDPLMRAGKTTITLDNTGHTETDRARGTSAKEDLCDVAFTMRAVAPFSTTLAGRLELRCVASRLGEVGGAWQMELGAGQFGAWRHIGAKPPEAREDLHEAAVEVLLASDEPLGYEKVGKAIRARPGNALRFAAKDLRAGLNAWAADPASGVLRDHSGKGFTAHVEPPRHDPRVEGATTQLDIGTAGTASNAATAGDPPMSGTDDTGRASGHVAVSPPYGGDTDDTRPATGVHPNPLRAQQHGEVPYTDAELQAIIDRERCEA